MFNSVKAGRQSFCPKNINKYLPSVCIRKCGIWNYGQSGWFSLKDIVLTLRSKIEEVQIIWQKYCTVNSSERKTTKFIGGNWFFFVSDCFQLSEWLAAK